MRSLFFILLSVVSIAASPASAEKNKPKGLTREQVDSVGREVHALLPNGRLMDGSYIGAEKARGLIYPLIPFDLIEFVIVRGNIAGFAAHCDLDWKNDFYAPLMKGLRQNHKEYTEYQWAYIGMLHGTSMSGAEQSMEGQPCPSEVKENLNKAAFK